MHYSVSYYTSDICDFFKAPNNTLKHGVNWCHGINTEWTELWNGNKSKCFFIQLT